MNGPQESTTNLDSPFQLFEHVQVADLKTCQLLCTGVPGYDGTLVDVLSCRIVEAMMEPMRRSATQYSRARLQGQRFVQ